ncbi:hypothetical protein [Hymenobacter sp. YC55]|uniref:hypothetical protein n=1 Tax=Hymenobacter sp. YC55 TaxID=3034019 RepID=UPI0023FA22BC|nr:hypothetical protein [Hymenobacter sp. YC55]MDF7815354.1 hypothetical protein [Hymenobacter sp. YC55]
MSQQLPLCFDAPLDPTAKITTDAHAARVGARIDQIWTLAEARWQEGGRPLRFIGCSYYVVNFNQHSDRSAYLSEAESTEFHALAIRHSLYANDPYRARERVVSRLAMLRAERENAVQLVSAS